MAPDTDNQQNTPPIPSTGHSHKWFWVAIIVLLLLAAGSTYYVYSWQNKKVNKAYVLLDSSNKALGFLQNSVNDLQTSTKTTPADYHDELIAGNVKVACQSGVGLKVCGDIKYKFSLNLTELWVSYGTSPDKLTNETVHVTKELGLGEGSYGSYDFNINNSSLTPGTTYYYRVTGKTKDGKIIQGSLNFFTTER